MPIDLEFEQTWARLNEEREFAELERNDVEGEGSSGHGEGKAEGRVRKKRKASTTVLVCYVVMFSLVVVGREQRRQPESGFSA